MTAWTAWNTSGEAGGGRPGQKQFKGTVPHNIFPQKSGGIGCIDL